MGIRFTGLRIVTAIFQILCVIAFLAGLFAIFAPMGGFNAGGGPLVTAAPGIRIFCGAVFSFLAIGLYVYAGGVRTLIGIDERTGSVARLENAIYAGSPNAPRSRPTEVGRREPATVTSAAESDQCRCGNCGAANAADSNFCKQCGAALQQAAQ